MIDKNIRGAEQNTEDRLIRRANFLFYLRQSFYFILSIFYIISKAYPQFNLQDWIFCCENKTMALPGRKQSIGFYLLFLFDGQEMQ